jgi:hypothetical protein
MGFEILKTLLNKFALAIPNIFGAIFIAFLGFFIAKTVSKIVARILRSIGADKFAERLNSIDFLEENKIRIQISKICGQIVYYIILLFALVAATEVLQMPALSKLITDIFNYIPSVLSAMIVMIFGVLIANTLKNLVLTACLSLNIPSAKLISSFVFYFVFLTAAISALSQARIDTDFVKSNISIILGGGVAAFALGYGLASKDLMANFLASFYGRARLNVGDVIKIGETVGRIAHIDNTSIILNGKDKQVLVPLSKILREEVEILPNDFLQISEK